MDVQSENAEDEQILGLDTNRTGRSANTILLRSSSWGYRNGPGAKNACHTTVRMAVQIPVPYIKSSLPQTPVTPVQEPQCPLPASVHTQAETPK